MSRGIAKITNNQSSTLEYFNRINNLASSYFFAYRQRGLIKYEQEIKDFHKTIQLYHPNNKIDKIDELEIAIANLNLNLYRDR